MRLVGVPSNAHARHEEDRRLHQPREGEHALGPRAVHAKETLFESLRGTGADAVAGHHHKLAACNRRLHLHRRLHAYVLDGVERECGGVETAHEHLREHGIVRHLLEGVDVRRTGKVAAHERQGWKDFGGADVRRHDEGAAAGGKAVAECAEAGVVAHCHARKAFLEGTGVRLVGERPREAKEMPEERPGSGARSILMAERREHPVEFS